MFKNIKIGTKAYKAMLRTPGGFIGDNKHTLLINQEYTDNQQQMCLFPIDAFSFVRDTRALVEITVQTEKFETYKQFVYGNTKTFFKVDKFKIEREVPQEEIDELCTGEFSYFDENNTLRYVENYRKGVPHGKFDAWYSNGVRKSIGYYQFGKRHGTQAAWSVDGRTYYDFEY